MGCVQLRIRPHLSIDYDLGNLPSSQESSPTSINSLETLSNADSPKCNPMMTPAMSNFIKFRRNAQACYFCNSNYGLLCKPFTCDCDFWGHFECFKKWIAEENFFCSICKKAYYRETVKRYGDKQFKKALCVSVLEEAVKMAVARQECLFLLKQCEQK